MKDLPINKILPKLKEEIQNNQKVILQASAGAGKSTVVPISLLDEAWLEDKIIIMLEPRRVAARMVAMQMARLLGEEVGQRVGYQIKMDSCKSSKTKILVVTEAILTRKLQADQALEDIALIIFDEFHERSIHSDLSLALSLQSQELLRDDLKILLMSATLNEKELSILLDDAPVVSCEGRVFPIEYSYFPKSIKHPDSRSLNSLLVDTVLNACKHKGDILVFLAGAKQIKILQESLRSALDDSFEILPLYSNLSKQEQDGALSLSSKRKIILSTNISQTSLTIEGVNIVIDAGVENQANYDHNTGLNHLELCFISEDSAIQRAGRAGRLQEGRCYRLWHEDRILQKSTKPEILRSDLTQTVLELSLWGASFEELRWLDIPNKQLITQTKELLVELNMIDEKGEITTFGEECIALGVQPRFGFMLLKANELGFAYEACILASLLSQKDIYKNSFRSADLNGRFLHLYEKDFNNSLINSFQAKQVLKEADYLFSKLKKIKAVNKKSFKKELLSVLLLFAYPDRLAKQRAKDDNRYILSNKKGAVLDRHDSLFNSSFLVVPSLSAKQKDSFINQALPIELKTIKEYFPYLLKTKELVDFDKSNNRVTFKEVLFFLELNLESKPIEKPSAEELVKLFLQLVKDEGLELLTWSKKANELRNRVNFINAHDSLDLPDFTKEGLIKSLSSWLEPYLSGVSTIKQLQELDTYNMLLGLISWERQQELDSLAPSTLQVPSGSKIKIDYSDLNKPILKVKIQEVFGLLETPKILNSKMPLQIELLSPALRPIQITYDLKSFWETSYDEVRKELRGKYKKHYWPENPYEAVATNRTKKNMDK